MFFFLGVDVITNRAETCENGIFLQPWTPHPAFCHLPYGEVGRSPVHNLMCHDVIKKWPKFSGQVTFSILFEQQNMFNAWYLWQLSSTSWVCVVSYPFYQLFYLDIIHIHEILYQALPAFLYCKWQKAGCRVGNEATFTLLSSFKEWAKTVHETDIALVALWLRRTPNCQVMLYTMTQVCVDWHKQQFRVLRR